MVLNNSPFRRPPPPSRPTPSGVSLCLSDCGAPPPRSRPTPTGVGLCLSDVSEGGGVRDGGKDAARRSKTPSDHPSSKSSDNVYKVLHSISDETESSKKRWKGACFYDRPGGGEVAAAEATAAVPCSDGARPRGKKAVPSRGSAGVAEALRSDETRSARNTLGKSATPGVQNVDTERHSEGPTVRTDLPKDEGPSSADVQTYGDAFDAAALFRSGTCASRGIDGGERAAVHRTPEELRGLVQDAGLVFQDAYEAVAAKNAGVVTVETFCNTYYAMKKNELRKKSLSDEHLPR